MFEWIKTLTGEWGPYLINLYKLNAIWINSLVLIYGIVLLLAWRNLDQMQENLVNLLIVADRSLLSRINKNEAGFSTADISEISWEEAFKANQFPLLSRQNGFSLHRASIESFKKATITKEFIKRLKKHSAIKQ